MFKFFLISILLLLSLSPIISQHISLTLYKNYFASNSTDLNNGFLSEDLEDLAIDNIDDSFYTVNVSLGSDRNPYSLVVDTLSFFVWITAPDLQSGDHRHHFDCTSSTTCSLSNLLYPIYFENGTSVQGSIITDTLYLDGVNVTQKMVIVNNSISIAEFPADGQLGIGPLMTIAGFSVGPDTVVENLQKQGDIGFKSFAIYLCNNTQDVNSSEIVFGGYDSNRMQTGSNFSLYPLVNNDALGIKLSNVTFGNSSFNTSQTAMFDSRASAIVAARDDFASLLSIVQAIDPTCNSTVYGELTFITCNCSTGLDKAASYPDLSFVFEGDNMTYVIRPDQYVYMDQNGNCVLDIGQASILSDNWSVGHQFMKNYYTFYDMDNNQIGIAPVVQDC